MTICAGANTHTEAAPQKNLKKSEEGVILFSISFDFSSILIFYTFEIIKPDEDFKLLAVKCFKARLIRVFVLGSFHPIRPPGQPVGAPPPPPTSLPSAPRFSPAGSAQTAVRCTCWPAWVQSCGLSSFGGFSRYWTRKPPPSYWPFSGPGFPLGLIPSMSGDRKEGDSGFVTKGSFGMWSRSQL